MDATWSPLTVHEVARRFDGLGVPWWVAGGVAIDLFLGWESRPHDDLDIELFRRDRSVLLAAFEGWDLHAVSDGRLIPWNGGDLPDEVFGIWARPGLEHPWAVEVMLADGDGRTWRFRRDPSISMSVDRLLRRSPEGIPYCAPDVQLLYKAKRNRPKDDADLARCLHRLDLHGIDWLRHALSHLDAAHPWIPVLDSAAERWTRMADRSR